MSVKEFPYAKPIESDIEMFIQWKGTDVCVDIYCPCGHHGHVDGYFAHNIKCGGCGSVYVMGTQVIAKRINPETVKDETILVAD
jgi:hypothetical protein